MKQSDDKRRLIIGAPLMLIVVFCFGFFLMHPGGNVGHATVSDATASKKMPTDDSSPSASQLQNLPKAEPAQTESSSSAVASDSTTSEANDSGSGVSPSQPASKPSTTNIKNGTSQVKNSTGKSTTSTSYYVNNQQGLIQTVFNSLLNGR